MALEPADRELFEGLERDLGLRRLTAYADLENHGSGSDHTSA